MAESKASGGHRRNVGGARREASERVLLRRDGFETSGWTLNLSRGGIRVILEEPAQEGLEYLLSVGDPGSTAARRVQAVWIRDEADGQIAGLKFLDVEGSVPPFDARDEE